MQVNEVLSQCKISGQVVTLPYVKLDRKLYQEVAKKIELIGGKWCRKNKGFVFQENPSELFEAIKNGEKKDLKKEYQFFETPKEVAEKMAKILEGMEIDTILEPSAGRGAVCKAINKICPPRRLFYCELMELNRKQFKGDAELLMDDFLALPEHLKFDAIVANPPFSKNQDIEHFMKMDIHARKIIISIMSNHWRNSQNKKETAFREFLEGAGAEIHDLPAGTFKESGTMVGACIVVVRK